MANNSTFAQSARRLGPARTLVAIAYAVRNQVLAWRFGFDRWHIRASYYARPYKAQVVELIDACEANVVCEVGCGLGDIMSRVKAPVRLGVDIDHGAISAARLLHGHRCTFWAGNLGDFVPVHRGQPVSDIGVLVMVNWLHALPAEQVTALLRDFTARTRVRWLLMDLVYENSDRSCAHTAESLSAIGKVARRIAAVDGARDLVLIEIAHP